MFSAWLTVAMTSQNIAIGYFGRRLGGPGYSGRTPMGGGGQGHSEVEAIWCNEWLASLVCVVPFGSLSNLSPLLPVREQYKLECLLDEAYTTIHLFLIVQPGLYTI